MRILDGHSHILSRAIVDNVMSRTDLINRLSLQMEGVYSRLDTTALLADMAAANVRAAVVLPTSDVRNVGRTNRAGVSLASAIPDLFTAGTLHPDYHAIGEELSFLSSSGVRIIKLCSFSQHFGLNDSHTHAMFQNIQNFNETSGKPFAVVLDTLTVAHQYFGTDPRHTATPQGLRDLATRFPAVIFIGAHMGGLAASFAELKNVLTPQPNLYLDTSNASYTLTADQFTQMLHAHGPDHIIFGTDWPWFVHRIEVERVEVLLEKAGFSAMEKESVFSRNLGTLLGIDEQRLEN